MAFLSSRAGETFRSSTSVQWASLIVFSAIFAAALEALHLSAAFLLGPMLAGIVVASSGARIRIDDTVFAGTQAVIGCMIARAMPPSVLQEVAMQWPVFVLGVTSTVAMAALVGWTLARLRVLPGTCAIWGSAPGGAAAMTMMAEAHGADIRLVAFMQYLRVVCVMSVASLVASTAIHDHPLPAPVWFPAADWFSFAETLALAAFCLTVAKLLRIRAGALLVPLIASAILSNTGLIHLELPPWFLAISFALLGWAIGLRFTRESVVHAARALPRVFAGVMLLIAACAGVGQILVPVAGVNPLTAYLATSPGGIDAVAVIATDSAVDAPFVLSMQFARLIVVLATGPWIVRFLAGRAAEHNGSP